MCRIDFGHIQKNMITTIELIDMALCFVCVCVCVCVCVKKYFT